MKSSIQIIFSAVLLMVISCQNGSTDSKGVSDSELIQAIIDADKISIGVDDLPSNSKTVIEYDYNEYESESAKKAYGLGYEVNMSGKGHKVGNRCEVYFNLEGRKLDPYGRNGDKDKSDWDRDNDKGDWKCFDLSLPVSYTMPDGSTITVSNEEDWDAIKDWYEANPDSEEKPELQFPVNVEFDDEIVTVNSEEELRELKQECWLDENDKRECFYLVFPVTYIMPDGSTITVETKDDDAGWQLIKDWYDANPDSDERPTLQFPVNITYETEDGDTTLTVNNDEEMNYVKSRCREEWADGDSEEDEECYEFVLPISFTMPDGTTITIENEEDWYNLREWYVNNSEAEEEPLLQYPVNVILLDEEGTSVTLNNDEEMTALEEECWGNDDEGDRP